MLPVGTVAPRLATFTSHLQLVPAAVLLLCGCARVVHVRADRPSFPQFDGVPPAPFASWGMQSSTVAYFVGSDVAGNSTDELAAEARLGVAGLGWQLNGTTSNWTHVEAAEITTARALKALRPAVKVLVGRNSEVVAPFYDSVAKVMCADSAAECSALNPEYTDFWLQKDGKVIVGDWNSPRENRPKVWPNFSNPAVVEWWKNEFVMPAVRNPLFDGVHWDCSCGMPHGVGVPKSFHTNLQAAFADVQQAMLSAGKWSTTWFADGSGPNSTAPFSHGKDVMTAQRCVQYLVGTGAFNNVGAGVNRTWQFREPHRKTRNDTDPAPWGYSRRDAVAAFLLMRGPSSFFYFMVAGAYEDAKMYYWDADLLEADYGEPVDIVPHVPDPIGAPLVVVRNWSKATIKWDCGTSTSSIILREDDGGSGPQR